MSAQLKIQTPTGGVEIQQTGIDTATLIEYDVNGVAIETYDLVNIKATANQMDADVDGMIGVEAHLVFLLSTSELTATVTKSWFDDGETDYPLLPNDHKAAQDFLATAQFPPF